MSTVHILIRDTHSRRPHPHQTSIRGPDSCASSALASTAEQSHKTTTRHTADHRTRVTSDLDAFSYADQAQSAMPATLVPTSANCPAALHPEHGRLLRLPASTVVEHEPEQIELSTTCREQLHSTGAERTADELAFAASGRPREHRRRASILVPLYGKHGEK